MNEALALTFAVAVPFLCLGLVMWLARLEDTLADGLESPRATRQAPQPVAAERSSEPVAAAA